MVHFNMKAAAESSNRELTPGTDLWFVTAAKSGFTANKDPKIDLMLKRISDPRDWLFETLSLGGPGAGIAAKKLRAMGYADDFDGEVDPLDLIGKEVWAATGVQEYQGKKSLRVMIGELKYAGMQPRDDVPAGCSLPPDDDALTFGN